LRLYPPPKGRGLGASHDKAWEKIKKAIKAANPSEILEMSTDDNTIYFRHFKAKNLFNYIVSKRREYR